MKKAYEYIGSVESVGVGPWRILSKKGDYALCAKKGERDKYTHWILISNLRFVGTYEKGYNK